jgi:hypothetical protein
MDELGRPALPSVSRRRSYVFALEGGSWAETGPVTHDGPMGGNGDRQDWPASGGRVSASCAAMSSNYAWAMAKSNRPPQEQIPARQADAMGAGRCRLLGANAK